MKNFDKNNIAKNNIFKILKYCFLITYAVLMCIPFLWVFMTSFKKGGEVYTSGLSFPKEWYFDNYINIFKSSIGAHFLNSIYISLTAVFCILLFSSMASYIIARFNVNKKIYVYYTIGIMIPIHVMLIPIFSLLTSIGLKNTHVGLVLIYVVCHISISVFILTGFMKGLSKEIEEAALIDGCSLSGIFFKIVLPISKPGLATVGIFAFQGCWNDYLWAAILINAQPLKTLTQAIYDMKGYYYTDYGALCAGLSVSIIPVAVSYIIFQEQVIKGMTAGAVKG